MTTSPAQVLQALLANPRDLANVKSVTTPDVTYVSLNEDNPELKRFLPWTGTNQGPEAIVRAFEGIGRAWETKAFEVREVIEQGERVAMFGSFVSRAPVRPGNHVALLAPREAERRQDSLRPVSRGHVRYLGNPRASAILTRRRLEHSERPGATMNKDLGVWTDQDCALVLIDYQKEIFATIRSETSAALAELNVRLLA